MLLAALGLPGCELIHDDDMDCQLYTPEGVPYAYVSIALSTAMTPSTRANPTGGEGGDGEEPGQANENEVNDITLFFYEATGYKTDKGVNSAAETKVIRQYFGNNDINYTTGQQASTNTVPVEELLVNHDYYVLAVVNGGESFGENITTLGALQQETVKELYKKVEGSGDEATYSNFLMASADDENQPLHIIPSNSETNPATTQIDVERVTARVDYRAEGDTDTDGVYAIEDVGTARITGAMLVNTLNDDAESWLLKRVADTWGSTDVEYLGLETTDPTTNAASNYVIDAKEEKVEADFTPATYFPNIGYDNLTWEGLFVEGSLIEGLEDNYSCVGYPKENVNQVGSRDRTTGIVFRAVFTPEGSAEGDTFFEWDNVVYPTLEAMMEAVYKDSWEVINGTWSDISTWENLRANIIPELDDDPVGYRAYLRQVSNGKTGTISEKEKNTLRWAYYLEHTCFYKVDENGKAQVDVNDAAAGTTRRILHDLSGLSTYKNGICYYTYWIKHANDQDPSNDLASGKDNTGGVMEYAIVRNNVYKLDIKSVSTPGNDIPGERTVNINVLVEDWQLIKPGESVDLEPVKEGGA